jgi:hypothetical protein
MMMKYLFLVILYLAPVRTIEVSAAKAFYCVILRFGSTDYARGTHIHINNYG